MGTEIPDPSDCDFASTLGGLLVQGVQAIDRNCDHLIRGIEGGLCNIKSKYAPLALSAFSKKLTEETLTSWLLAEHLRAEGITTTLELHYPGSRDECDLVLHFPNDRLIWIEVKYAWKRWYNCTGTTGRSSAYTGYLFGDRSHPGAAHDFKKLESLGRSDAFGAGMLLIGFDSQRAKMDSDIELLTEREALLGRDWSLATTHRWADRRNDKFRITCWFWYRPS